LATREHIHQLIEPLPEDDLDAVEEFVERLCSTIDDPFARAHLRAALHEPETLSPEDEAALVAADEGIAAGRVISHDEVGRGNRWYS
jgi:hypothetical protein